MDKIKFTALIDYITLIIQRNVGTLLLNEIEEIDQITKSEPAKVNCKDVDNLMAAMQAGVNKIDAIKAYRVLVDAGLLEAKNAVEKY